MEHSFELESATCVGRKFMRASEEVFLAVVILTLQVVIFSIFFKEAPFFGDFSETS